MNKKVFTIITGLFLLASPLTGAAEDIDVSGSVDLGIKQLDQDNNSSKFNEYKDDENNIYINELNLSLTGDDTIPFFDFKGSNLSRDDQEISIRHGLPGKWQLEIDWSEIPHLISNQAKTPYDYLGNGRYRVSGGIVDDIQISSVANASSWTAADLGPGLAGEDIRINNVLANSVHAIELGTHRETGEIGFTYHISDKTAIKFGFKQDNKNGSIITGAPIGDRPPRSMTVQLPEPIDYRTEDYRITAEHNLEKVQVEASYLYSKFYNDVDALIWNSLFHSAGYFGPDEDPLTADGGSDYDEIRIGSSRKYATSGRMALNPDNTYNHLSLKIGADLPMESRLNITVAQGKMEQDENLLPYATSNFGGALDALPRENADAEIITTFLNAVYVISPVDKLKVKISYRSYEVDNKTTESEFDYYTQDTDSQNYRNERKNLAYGHKKDNIGIDLTYYMKRMGTLGLGYENEQVERDYRETSETDEDIVKISYKVRPARGVSFKAKYLKGDRDGGTYDGEVTDESYHYDAAANQAEADNPLLGFGNAPGLRKYDVTERERDELDLMLALNPADTVGVNLSYSNRKNDYDSPVSPTITTWDSDAGVLAYVTVAIDPTQLGLLEDKSNSYSVDVSYYPNSRLVISGFFSRDEMESEQRGRYLNENNRINNIALGKDWQDTTGKYIWDATVTDTTDTINIGVNYEVIRKKLDFTADLTHSKGVVEIDYSAGSYIVEDDIAGTANHGEWYSPEDTEFETNTAKIGLAYHMTKNLTFGFDYTYEKYEVTDWQQEGSAAHQDALSEQYVTDYDPETAGLSNDRVGARLVRLTDYVAPDYEVHMAMLSMKCKW